MSDLSSKEYLPRVDRLTVARVIDGSGTQSERSAVWNYICGLERTLAEHPPHGLAPAPMSDADLQALCRQFVVEGYHGDYLENDGFDLAREVEELTLKKFRPAHEPPPALDRYYIEMEGDISGPVMMERVDPNGEWVRYEDVAPYLAAGKLPTARAIACRNACRHAVDIIKDVTAQPSCATLTPQEQHAIHNVLNFCQLNPSMASTIDVTARKLLKGLLDRASSPPSVTPITLNGRQVAELYDFMDLGANLTSSPTDSYETDISIQWFDERPPVDGLPSPAGYYAWFTDYSEEGSLYLNDQPSETKSGEPDGTTK